MYHELYTAWLRETQEASLGSLPPDFYVRISEYLKRMKEENRAFDKKSVKLNLLEHETQNAQRMLEELLWARYKKLMKTVTKIHKVPSELLTTQETKMSENFTIFADAYQKFAKTLLDGLSFPTEQATTAQTIVQPAAINLNTQRKTTLRFVKNIPAIMGADMKAYGPFKIEDVASLPAENARILIKQGLAVAVEVS